MSEKNIITINITPTISTSAYGGGDNIGGLLKFKTPDLTENQRVLLQSMVLTDANTQQAAINCVFFREKPALTTFTDNGILTVNDADLPKIIHSQSISTYIAFSNNAFSSSGAIAVPLFYTDAIYAALVTTGTPTYAATNDISLSINLIQR